MRSLHQDSQIQHRERKEQKILNEGKVLIRYGRKDKVNQSVATASFQVDLII